MKSVSPSRLLLVVGLPCAGFLAAWLLRGRTSVAPPDEPAPASAATPVAERRALVPESGAGGLASEAHPLAAPAVDWIELNNEATNDLTAGDLAGAIEKFERCRAADPASAAFAGNLAEALVRLAKLEHERGQLESALAHLTRALEVGLERGDREVLLRILERWRRELELEADDWTEGSNRFELTYDTDRADILHHSHEVLEHLEQSYDELVRWFGRDPLAGRPPLRVVLYAPADFGRLTGLGDWAAGLFDGVVRVSLRDLEDGSWRAVLVHELVHAFVQALRGNATPGWLNEGVAQLLEGRVHDAPHLRERLRGVEPFPLERLQGSLASWEDPNEIARAYAQSLVFVAYLRETYGDESLRRMLDGGPERLDVAPAFEQFTSVALALAFQDWCAAVAR